MKSIVTVRTCETYELGRVAETAERILTDLGGMQSYIRPGERVLIKPNLLKSASPEQAVVTHPAVVEAVASMMTDCGAKLFIGDSPPLGNLSRVLSRSGYDEFMKKMDIQAVPFVNKTATEFSDGRLFRRMNLAQEVFEFDKVINIAKLKTHCQMFLTLAVKNLFGTIIGTDKASLHLTAGKDTDNFATVLVQILEKVKPTLSIIDGIVGMEGDGPNSGTPRSVGIMAASKDAVALDAVVCTLLGYEISALKTCVIGQKLGAGVCDPERIEILGDDLCEFPVKDFRMPKSMSMAWNLSYWNPVRRFMENHVVTKPKIDPAACSSCGICRKHCPPQAIEEVDGIMKIDRRKCISCFCCHELCSNDAVRVVQPFFGRLLSSLTK